MTVWKRKILTVCKGKFWQFVKENFDSLKRKILTVWKRQILTVWKRKILTVCIGKFWQFEKENPVKFSTRVPTIKSIKSFGRKVLCSWLSPAGACEWWRDSFHRWGSWEEFLLSLLIGGVLTCRFFASFLVDESFNFI